MPKNKFPEVKPDISLIFQLEKIATGANIHKIKGTFCAYRFWAKKASTANDKDKYEKYCEEFVDVEIKLRILLSEWFSQKSNKHSEP